MPIAKLIVALVLPILFAIALLTPGDRAVALAQLPPPNPLVAPLPAPRGPAQLPAPSQAQGVPSLIAVPTPAAASPTPAPRVFNCSCSGSGVPTSWMGRIGAAGYFAARQAATGACLSFNERREPAPPQISTHQASSFGPAATLPQGFENPNLASSTGSNLPGKLTTSSAAQLAACSQCACD
jgi:hypothetical protein